MALSERVKSLLQGPEGLEVEFKSQIKGLHPEDITAFANARGGTILIGVEEKKRDTGEAYGVPIGVRGMADTMHSLQSIVAACNPKVEIRITEEATEDGKAILILDIEEGKAKPYWTSAGLYVIRRTGRNDAIDPLMLKDLLAGPNEVQQTTIQSLVIANDGDGSIPSMLFFGYRFLMFVSHLWSEVQKKSPESMALLRERNHKDERDALVAASVEAAIIRWLSYLAGMSVYMDGRPSPMTPRLFFDKSIEKTEIGVAGIPGLLSGNPLLNVFGDNWAASGIGKSIVVPKGFSISVDRPDPNKGPRSLIKIHADDGEVSFAVFRFQGARGIPPNTPQAVRVPREQAHEYWIDQIIILVGSTFPRPSREKPKVDAYRAWYADLVSNFKLEFDWHEYVESLPDKEIVRTQMMLEAILHKLEGNPPKAQ